MVTEIRLYIEGGGDQKAGKDALRAGWGEFLSELRQLARTRRVRWSIIAGGGRNNTFDDFKKAIATHPLAMNILLVDSEGPLSSRVHWQHLENEDSWRRPVGVDDEQCHLMVQTMEAWLIADPDSLRTFYGNNFHAQSLPQNPNPEQVPKDKLLDSLTRATRDTRKGKYDKVRHAFPILETLQLQTVCSKVPSCRRLRDIVSAAIENNA